MAPAREDRQVAVRLGGAVALALLLLGQAQVTVLDGSSMLAVAQSIVHHGTLAVPAPLGVPGHDGLSYSKYGLLLPLLSVIPVLVAQPLGALMGRLDLWEAALAASIMPLVAGALAAALYVLGRRLAATRAAAALVAAGIVLGTYLLPYGRDFFTEPLVALGLVVMVERAFAGRELEAGAALAFAVLARPQSALLAPLLLAFLLARGVGPQGILRVVAPLAVAAAITVAYNIYRFADPLEFGYKPPADPGFTTPLLHGAGGLLFSPEKSIFLFAPAILLVPWAVVALWRRQRALVVLVLALFAATFLLAATWHSWQGGWSWGPRLVIPGIVLVLVLLAPWIAQSRARMRIVAVLCAAGFAVSLAALFAPVGTQLLNKIPGVDGPQIVRQYRELPQLARRSVEMANDPAARHDDQRRYLATWQAGIVRQVGVVAIVPAVLGTLAGLLALWWVAHPLTGLVRTR
ncbi:MAG TPA: hypothetical protein VF526_00300 [Solirubrobacteraceae bacterium]